MSTDAPEASAAPVVEMVVEVRLIYQPFYDLGIRESGICYSIVNAKVRVVVVVVFSAVFFFFLILFLFLL